MNSRQSKQNRKHNTQEAWGRAPNLENTVPITTTPSHASPLRHRCSPRPGRSVLHPVQVGRNRPPVGTRSALEALDRFSHRVRLAPRGRVEPGRAGLEVGDSHTDLKQHRRSRVDRIPGCHPTARSSAETLGYELRKSRAGLPFGVSKSMQIDPPPVTWPPPVQTSSVISECRPLCGEEGFKTYHPE